MFNELKIVFVNVMYVTLMWTRNVSIGHGCPPPPKNNEDNGITV